MNFQSIILRRERAETPTVVTGVTVRYSNGVHDSVDCLEDRDSTLAELEGFILGPWLTYRVYVQHARGNFISLVSARDREEALAKTRHRFKHLQDLRPSVSTVQPTTHLAADF